MVLDRVSKEARSRIMRAIRSKGNKTTESRMLRLLRHHKLSGWRRHYPVNGTPDFAWPKEKVALFVDGCFWHGCPRCYSAPRTNQKFWEDKVWGNKKRDRRVSRQLRKSGWSVLRVWECSIEKTATISRIRRCIERRRSEQVQKIKVTKDID